MPSRKTLNHLAPILAALSLFLAPCAAQSNVNPSTAGKDFPRDGPVLASEYLKQWELSYYAEDYFPICGASTESEGSNYWSNSPECDPAMASFNSTAGLQKQKYNFAGVPSNAAFGEGEALCMCFAVAYTPVRDKTIDICLLVGSNGEVRERNVFLSGSVAVGLQSPEKDDSKALPQCKDLSLTVTPTPTGSTTFRTSRTAAPTSTGGVDSGSPSGTESSSSSGGGGGGAFGGLSTEAKIALGTGIPGGIVACAVIIGWCRKRV